MTSDERAELHLEAAAVLAKIAPEYESIPISFIDQARIEIFSGNKGCEAWVAKDLDRMVRPYLGITEIPATRFFCVLYNQARFEEQGLQGDDRRHEFIALAIHEFAHLIQIGAHSRGISDATIKAEEAALAAAGEREPAKMAPAEKAELLWEQWLWHDLDFRRIGLHAVYRANRLGYNLNATMAKLTLPFQSHVSHYRDRLGDEPQRFLGLRFDDILKIDPPKSFEDLWAHDLGVFDTYVRGKPPAAGHQSERMANVT